MREKPLNAALFMASIVFSLLALEIGLRVYHSEWQFTNFFHPGFLGNEGIVFDPELGWVPDRFNGGDGLTIFNGIRSNCSGEVPDPNEAILAVGDSFTFGNQVANCETWPAQLEKLSGRGVINAGSPGYGIDQTFLRARRLLSRNRFKTVIFSFIPDDITRCQYSVNNHVAKPYFDFKDGRLTLENIPVPPPPKKSGLLIAMEQSRLVNSVMERTFPKWWKSPRLPELTRVLDKKTAGIVACALLHELEGLTRSRGSELIVLVQHAVRESSYELMAGESILGCLSDPATRILDLNPHYPN